MSALWGAITVERTTLASTHPARSTATWRWRAETVSLWTLPEIASVRLLSLSVKSSSWIKDDFSQTIPLPPDINECLLLSNPCRPGQTCVNAVGSYVCLGNTVVCRQGYHPTADGTRCKGLSLSRLKSAFSFNFRPFTSPPPLPRPRRGRVSRRRRVRQPRLREPGRVVPLRVQSGLPLEQRHRSLRRFSLSFRTFLWGNSLGGGVRE